eukprot:GSChrysophyteH2.ASY1.ANO1.1044.1 assembled CDS
MASFGEKVEVEATEPAVATTTEGAVEATPAAEEEEGEAAADDENPEAHESTAQFEALVNLEEVEVKTHEEDEAIEYVQRAKLFVYGEASLDKGTGVKSWCERGVGDCKLLKHKDNNRIRVLMRQEGTLKIIVNHFVDPRITLTPNVGTDKSWIWRAHDFSNGETLEETMFAIRFKDKEIADKFKEAFEKAQAANQQHLAGADDAEGAKEADELSKAVEAVSVKPDEEEA